MGSLHDAGAVAALAAGGLLAVAGALAAWLDTAHRLVRRLALAVVLVFAAAAAAGIGVMASGSGPRDGLHLLYAAALIGVTPVGFVFAADAPPRARSGVLAVAGTLSLLLAWRLFATG